MEKNQKKTTFFKKSSFSITCMLLICLSSFFATPIKAKKSYSYSIQIADTCSEHDFGNSNNDENNRSFNPTQYSNFKNSYFDCLTQNYAMNYKGSCGYIAIAMLLSYYDTFLNDSIIPEIYDVDSVGYSINMSSRRNSPGTFRELIPGIINPEDENLTAAEYYSFIQSYKTTSLHAKLIDIGNSLGFYKFNDNNTPCGTNHSERHQIIEEYFSTVLNYSINEEYSFLYEYYSGISGSHYIKSTAINYILNGVPVILSISDGLFSGHVVVAYDYDPNNEIIYCHSGLDSFGTHISPEQMGYSYYTSIIALDFELQHNHPLNYGVSDFLTNQTSYYCYNDCYIYTHDGSLEHGEENGYLFLNNNSHRILRSCGHNSTSPHFINPESVIMINGHNYGYCSFCEHQIDLGGF